MKNNEKLAILCLVLILIAATLCGCARTSKAVDVESNDKDVVGYAIISHSDGDEHVPIVNYGYGNGSLIAYCADGRTIISTDITIVIE